ncbi:hypothetical protein N9H87_02030 [Pontimonas sp.]|nr:hypothetical protein [Pontimonas sp.]MDA8862983.1 hypothetical protein [Pontimonas sp.]
MKTSEIAHVIVGAGNIPYFVNALRSVKLLEAGDIFAAYNWVDSNDFKNLAESENSVMGYVKSLEVRRNDGSQRTGSLYEANNALLAQLRGRYRFVSFMQADMQLMWWNNRILETAENLIPEIRDNTEVVTFYTQLPVLGKHAFPYNGWSRDAERNAYFAYGHADVCLVPLFDGLNQDFSFRSTEKHMIREARRKQSRIFWHPYPFLSPIPFPITVRSQKKSLAASIPNFSEPILKVAPSYELDFSAPEFHPFSMEVSTVPNRWSVSYPFWPSDVDTSLWIQRRVDYVRRFGGSILAVKNHKSKIRAFTFKPYVPGNRVVLFALFKLALSEANKKTKKLILNSLRRGKRNFGEE